MAQSKTILIVEDEADIYRVLDRLLVDNGCYTAIAVSSKQALGFLKLLSFDLITLDLKLRATHGNNFLQELAKLNLEIPVIVVSGSVEELVPTKQVKAILCKPFTAQEFLAAVNQHLEQEADCF